MSKISLSGNASGTGTFTLASPNSSTDRTLDLPDASGVIDRLNRAGNVLQVVQATGTAALSTSSTSLVSSGFSASITPTSATNKIYAVFSGRLYNGTTNADAQLSIYRGATKIQGAYSLYNLAGAIAALQSVSILDSPATTSSTTYTIYFAVSTGTTYINVNGSNDGIYSLTLMEIAA